MHCSKVSSIIELLDNKLKGTNVKCVCIENNCKDCKHQSYHLQKDWCNRENMSCDDARNIKPLAKYLDEYLTQDLFTYIDRRYGDERIGIKPDALKRILEQALDTYESTENVKIRLERV